LKSFLPPPLKSAILIILVNAFFYPYSSAHPFSSLPPDSAVTIQSKGPYYLVTIDYRSGITPFEAGRQYGLRIKETVHDYEKILGVYMWQLATGQWLWGNTIPNRIDHIKPMLDSGFLEELNGMSSVMEETKAWTPDQLIFGFNLMPDVFRANQCSALGCWGEKSANGKTIAYRTLDWWGGLVYQKLPSIQAVTKIIYPDCTVFLIGVLGHLGCITGINYQTGIMAAILDAGSEEDYYSAGCRSYNFDLRHALEKSANKEEIANYLADSDKNYAYNHLIFLADQNNCKILENNTSGIGVSPRRALRSDTSMLNPGIFWNFPGMIGAVNSFILRGQIDNHLQGKHSNVNTERWELMQDKTSATLMEKNQKLTDEDLQEIMCSYHGEGPKSLIGGHGDLYNSNTQQMMLYIPEERSLEVYFIPLNGKNPRDPKPLFVRIPLQPY
jgi:hypothetical protein